MTGTLPAAREVEKGLSCLVAPNPGPLTGPGTNTWLLGEDSLAVIDPGPDDDRHLAALLAAIAGRSVSHILVTHAHADHSALAPRLAAATGAPVLAFGDARAGRDPVLADLEAAGHLPSIGEGVDRSFRPDLCLTDGDEVAGHGWSLTVLHTPGHMGNHIALTWGGGLFVGDTAMAWATSVIAPPEGHMTAYLATLDRLLVHGARVLWPGHGQSVTDPAARIAALITHRRGRAAAIQSALMAGDHSVAAITARVYADTDQALWPAAAQNVLAHLVDFWLHDRVSASPAPGPRARWSLP